jgi:hypothetical protein
MWIQPPVVQPRPRASFLGSSDALHAGQEHSTSRPSKNATDVLPMPESCVAEVIAPAVPLFRLRLPLELEGIALE